MQAKSTLKYPFPEKFDFDQNRVLSFLEKFTMLNRTAVSEDTDVLIDYLCHAYKGTVVKANANTDLIGGWRTPYNWKVNHARLKDNYGNILIDFDNHPLHLWTHSCSFKGKISRSDLLEKHIYTNKDRPDEFMYHYVNGYRDVLDQWGFSIPYSQVNSLTDEYYYVDIDTELNDRNTIKTADIFLEGDNPQTIFICAHTCHPGIVSDGLGCIAVALELYHLLAAKKNRRYSYRFLFGPEYFGAANWLTNASRQHVDNLHFGMFLDMLTSNSTIGFQSSAQGRSLIDWTVDNVFKSHVPLYAKRAYRELWGNDEMFYNGPEYLKPTIGIGRTMHREYHYNTDNMENFSAYNTKESAWLISRVLEALEMNFIPKLLFTGPLYLSRYNLHINASENIHGYRAIENMLIKASLGKSCLEIAQELELDAFFVYSFFTTLVDKGLCKKCEFLDWQKEVEFF